MPRTFLLLTAVMIAFAAATTRAAEPLRWKFEAGENIGFRMTQQSKMKLNAPQGGSFETTTSQTADIVWNIEQVNADGSAKIRQNITRMQMSMAGPSQNWRIDTASDEPPQGLAATLAPVFDALVDSDYVVTMSARGEITDVEAPEKLIEALKNMPGVPADGASDEMIRQMAKQSALTLPEGPLEEGDTWNTSVTTNAPFLGDQKVETTYKYIGAREVEGNTMEVFEPSITMTAEEEGAQPAVQASLEVTDSSGEVLFNRDEGRLASSTMKQNMAIEVSTGGRTITGDIEQSVKLERKDAAELEAAASADDEASDQQAAEAEDAAEPQGVEGAE